MKKAPAFFHLILAGLICVLIAGRSAQGQNLFVENGDTIITEITPGDGQSQFASGLTGSLALASDNQGDLYVTASDSVYEFSPGGTKSTFITGLTGANYALAFDSSGDLYVSENRFVYEYAPTGTETGLLEYQNEITAMAFDGSGDLFTANYLGNSSTILERKPGQASTVFASGLDEASGLAFNSVGDLFVSDAGTGDIYEYTPDGTGSIFGTGLDQPYGLAFNDAGELFVAEYGNGDIAEIAPDGTQSSFATGLENPARLAFQGETLPVPEPSVLRLFVLGVTGLVFTFVLRRFVAFFLCIGVEMGNETRISRIDAKKMRFYWVLRRLFWGRVGTDPPSRKATEQGRENVT